MASKAILPSTTSSATFFTALRILSSARSCPHTIRTFSGSSWAQQSSKRPLYTAPAYQPHSLPDFPLPPRNSNIPDTSIAGPTSEQTKHTLPSGRPGPQDPSEVASISLPEREAQKSRPVSHAATPPQQETSPPTQQQPSASKPRRKLRPRKAAVSITPPALTHLRSLLSSPTPQMIRIGVKNKGCSGLAYDLSYVAKPNPLDEVVEQDGVKVLIDSKALFSIIGSEMDWQEDKLSARFVFRNPNVTEQCGCGESFSVS